MTKYKLVVCGGTFDLLHKGHKTFLKKVFDSSDKVFLGITSNLYTQSIKKSPQIEDFEIRKQAVEQFLDSINVSERVRITSIDNAYEPYLETSTDYQVIAVTPQTRQTALDINLRRKQNDVSQLDILVIPMELAQDGKEISSTRIRNGEINRDGRLYMKSEWLAGKLVLPKNLRTELHKPFGEVLNDIPKDLDGQEIVTIGDITTQRFNQNNVGQFLSIIDFFVHRQVKFHQLSELGFDNQDFLKVENLRGTITPELFTSIRNVFKTKEEKIILVAGEEDLAVLPVLLIAPLGYSVFYGQPNEGLVRVDVTEENKEKAYHLAEKFNLEK
ncbi:MAG: pantetheine-phosphate adenylyltransferase [Patescibacteria group bacterium]|nr:pantetheine-phosphate adenylyltransferase [Patescibacteria group bacterium]